MPVSTEKDKIAFQKIIPKLDNVWPKFLFLTLAICSVATGGFLLLRFYSKVRAVQAFINSEVIFVRAPVAGKLKLDYRKIKLGNLLTRAAPIGTIESGVENPQVSVLKTRNLELEANFQVNQRQLDGLNRQLANRNGLMQFFKKQQQIQEELEVASARQNLQEEENTLAKTKALAEVASADARRFSFLAGQGAVGVSTAERRAAEAKQTSAETEIAQARINRANLGVKAAIAGVQLLEGSRTLSFPKVRILELGSEITDLKGQAENTRKQIQSLRVELDGVRKELQTQKLTPVLVPKEGVVWSINAQPEENVGANAPIIQLLRCSDTWVEAFVNERDANQLSIGQPVEITLPGNQARSWRGRVETVRAGTGRVEVGQFVVQPPPEITRRQLPVRVVTVRIAVDWQKSLTRSEFCGAGLSVQVRFIN